MRGKKQFKRVVEHDQWQNLLSNQIITYDGPGANNFGRERLVLFDIDRVGCVCLHTVQINLSVLKLKEIVSAQL